jgi:hypothetical protein
VILALEEEIAMTLRCNLFAGDAKLESAAVANSAHVMRGATGPHVGKIQKALISIDDAKISKDEISTTSFGADTEKAVLTYKQKRSIINTDYQQQADAIVGIMTMKSLDEEMLKFQSQVNELTILSALATAFGYTPEQAQVVTNSLPLRSTIDTLKSNIGR